VENGSGHGVGSGVRHDNAVIDSAAHNKRHATGSCGVLRFQAVHHVGCGIAMDKAELWKAATRNRTLMRALNVRRGDLRYNQVNAIEKPQSLSPWGIYADSVDPLSGMVIATSINIWTHVNDLFSRGLVDTLRYISGELKTEDVTDVKTGADVAASRVWRSTSRAPSAART